MLYYHKVLSGLVVVTALAACGNEGGPARDPEAMHCSGAAQRLTKEVGNIQIIEAKAWTHEEVRNVRVRFAYPENEAGLVNGSVLCTYDFPVTIRGDNKRRPKAQSVYFRARHLSTNELLLLNIALRGTQ